MEFSNPYDTLSYDHKLVNEQLDIGYNITPQFKRKPKIQDEVTNRLREKQQLENLIKKELAQQAQQQPVQQPVQQAQPAQQPTQTQSAQQAHPTQTQYQQAITSLDELVDKKTLMFIIVVLFVFGIIQYVNYQNASSNLKDMFMMMCHMQQAKPAT